MKFGNALMGPRRMSRGDGLCVGMLMIPLLIKKESETEEVGRGVPFPTHDVSVIGGGVGPSSEHGFPALQIRLRAE